MNYIYNGKTKIETIIYDENGNEMIRNTEINANWIETPKIT